jgi:hypothetical protein
MSKKHFLGDLSSNRSFGFVFSCFFGIVALWPLASGGTPRLWAALAAAGCALAASVFPKALALPNRLWQALGALLHHLVSPLVLGMMYFAVFFPFGLVLRLFGHDPLARRRNPGASSFWIRRERPGPAPEDMTNQF